MTCGFVFFMMLHFHVLTVQIFEYNTSYVFRSTQLALNYYMEMVYILTNRLTK